MGLLAGYGAWITALAVVYFALPELRAVTLSLVGLSAMGAIAAGVVARRPARRLPWLLMGAVALCFTASELSLQIVMRGHQARLPSLTLYDGFGFARYVLFAAALGLFARARSSGADRRSLLDAVTVTAGLAMLLWLFRIVPDLFRSDFSWEQRTVIVAYSIGQIVLLLALARLLASGAGWNWPLGLISGGVICALATNVVFGLLRGNEAHPIFWLADLGWIACFALCGAAAAHPAMASLTRPTGRRLGETSRGRLAAVTVASLVAPVLLIFYRNVDPRETTLTVSAALFYLLALLMLWGANASYLRSLIWERTLRASGPALASARSMEEIAAAVRTAADTVYGPRSEQAAIFAVRRDDELQVMMTSHAEGRIGRLAAAASQWLPPVLPTLAGRREPVSVSAEELESAASLGLSRSGTDEVLLWPLAIGGTSPGDSPAGVLALVGERRSLQSRWSSLAILADEAGLAMERVLLTQELIRREGLELFQALVQDTSDAILILNEDATIRYASPSAKNIFGDIPFEGTNVRALMAASTREWTPEDPNARTSDRDFHELWRIVRHDGRTVLAWVKYSDLRAEPGIQGRGMTFRDVTAQLGLQEELRHQAFHDSLTGLANRALFADRAEHALSLARRNGTVAAVLYMDLDDFKEVNDTLGHVVGDELLTAFAARLAQLARESDSAARISGDEFALLIENLADAGEADSTAARAVKAFGAPYTLPKDEVIMTASVGVATSGDSQSADELMRHADLALYAAKSEGKRRWQRYSPALSTNMLERLEIRSALEKAISDSAFALAYQPIVDLGTGLVSGLEALVRWPHPQLGLLMPGQFIEVAEDTGLVVPLGAWVMRRALSDLASGRGLSAGTRQPYVSVNVSARQFRSADFVPTVLEALDQADLPPSALLLELTESTLLGRDESIKAELAEIRRLGVRLAIDDFGTGYSSLSYLRELPFDILKIDKSFVDDIAISQQSLALVEGIVRIAETLEIAVVAEGIETSEQCELLTKMGCEYGQGYLLAKPMGWPAAADLLRSGRVLVPGAARPQRAR
jgi:diguanylate cyclase (GGDEF)-like protein/PAS domain S-box-containing protein